MSGIRIAWRWVMTTLSHPFSFFQVTPPPPRPVIAGDHQLRQLWEHYDQVKLKVDDAIRRTAAEDQAKAYGDPVADTLLSGVARPADDRHRGGVPPHH